MVGKPARIAQHAACQPFDAGSACGTLRFPNGRCRRPRRPAPGRQLTADRSIEPDPAGPSSVDPRVDAGLSHRRRGIELHRVGLDRGEHGVREILHHDDHAVGPGQREQRSGLRLAGLQGHAVPTERPAGGDMQAKLAAAFAPGMARDHVGHGLGHGFSSAAA